MSLGTVIKALEVRCLRR